MKTFFAGLLIVLSATVYADYASVLSTYVDAEGMVNYSDLLKNRKPLDEIEHKMLRKEYNEPRIHMALVCAARSCSTLRNEPYVGSRLDEQLADQSRDFLSLESRFNFEGDTAYLSQIFKWFKRDFESIPAFIKKYSGQDISDLKIRYLRYDWSLNEQRGAANE